MSKRPINEDVQKTMDIMKKMTIVNPDSKKKIQVSSALSYPKESSVYKAAERILKAQVEKNKSNKPKSESITESKKSVIKEDVSKITLTEFRSLVRECILEVMSEDDPKKKSK